MKFTPSPPGLVRAFDGAVDSLRGVERPTELFTLDRQLGS